MRYKFIILFLILGFVSKAQVYQLMPQYGYSTYRMNFDSTIQIPTFCGVPKLGSNKINKGALAFDSCNNRFYFFNPKSQAWDTIKSGSTIDTTKFVRYIDTSAMLLPYLRKVDTTNRFVSSVTKLNDSTIQVIKGTTTSNITISSVSSATRLITQVWNNTGATILRGSVVYISGRHSSNLPTIALAEGNNESNSYKTFALVDGDIPDNSSGFVIQAGKISGLNLPTSSYTDGDILYLSPTVPGGYTTTKPLAPNHIVKLGSVTRAHPTQGSIEIKIENGWELMELSDVQIAAVPADSTILQFSRVDSLWHDVSPLTAMGNRFVKRTDSAAMLLPYLRKVDTASISNRINLKLNISDTASMLANYARTNTVNAGLATKLNISDTSAMLSPYLRSIDTTNKFVTSIFRKTASDSVFFVRGGTNNFAYRDSLGVGGSPANPTALIGLTAVNGTAGTFMRSDAAPALSQSISPTWTGFHTFNRNATASASLARGTLFNPSLTAAANNDILSGVDISPTYTNGAFTGVSNYALRTTGGILIRGDGNVLNQSLVTTDYLNVSSNLSTGINNISASNTASTRPVIKGTRARGTVTNPTAVTNNDDALTFLSTPFDGTNSLGTAGLFFQVDGSVSTNVLPQRISFLTSTTDAVSRTEKLRISANGNVIVQNGGTYTDGGFNFDVNGTTRLQNTLQVGSKSIIGSEQVIFNKSVVGNSFPLRLLNDDNNNGITTQLLFTTRTGTSGTYASSLIGSQAENTSGNTALFFNTASNGTTTEGMRLNSNRNLLINTTTDIPSAKVVIESTTQGFLPPRMTTAQRDAIANPAAGLVIYNSTTNKHQGYNGTTWNDFY